MSVLDKFLDAIRLNDDYEEEDADSDSFFDEEDDDIEEKPKKRFFRKLENEDEDEEEEPQAKPVHTAQRKQPAPKTTASSQAAAARTPKPAAPVSTKVTPMRKKAGALNMEVCVIKPASMEDTREIADTLLAGCTVVLNLEGIDVDIAQRIIDFCCGACYCMSGSLQKVSSYIFILTPSSVEISGDIQDILSGAFNLPNIRTYY